MSSEKKYLAWKCKNGECGKVFFLPGRVSKEIRPLPKGGFTEETIREVKESPCCPFCFDLDFEPYSIEIKTATSQEAA